MQEEMAELRAKINKQETKLRKLKQLYQLNKIASPDILMLNGSEYKYKFLKSYDDNGGDVYEILNDVVSHDNGYRIVLQYEKNSIPYDRAMDETISCQLRMEGELIDMSGKLRHWTSNIYELSNSRFEIQFSYNMQLLSPDRIIDKRSRGE
jgi:hypothetical protein